VPQEAKYNLGYLIHAFFSSLEKKSEIRTHILDFEKQNVQDLNKELEKIKNIEKTATLMIKRVMVFFTEIDTKEAHELPQK